MHNLEVETVLSKLGNTSFPFIARSLWDFVRIGRMRSLWLWQLYQTCSQNGSWEQVKLAGWITSVRIGHCQYNAAWVCNKCDLSYNRIDVGSESNQDRSKSIKTHILALFPDQDCNCVEVMIFDQSNRDLNMVPCLGWIYRTQMNSYLLISIPSLDAINTSFNLIGQLPLNCWGTGDMQ